MSVGRLRHFLVSMKDVSNSEKIFKIKKPRKEGFEIEESFKIADERQSFITSDHTVVTNENYPSIYKRLLKAYIRSCF